MALSTMRMAARSKLMCYGQMSLLSRSVPMGTSAHDQMNTFWKKNQSLNRPNSPWIIHNWRLPMMTSLTHRTTGIVMGTALYGLAIGLSAAPGDFPSYLEAVKALELSPAIVFPVKTLMAFPLLYHYINGIRHLAFDAGYGFRLQEQYKSAYVVYSLSIALAVLLASLSYL